MTKNTDFYPRPRGGRPPPELCHAVSDHNLIHAREEGGDFCRPPPPCCCALVEFYPRPPRGGRHSSIGIKRVTLISIHALREEGDALDYAAKIKHAQFLSTPSARRATRSRRRRCWRRSTFLSTPPRGGRRYSDVPLDDHVRILSTPPRGGRPRAFASTSGSTSNFIHAPPRGGRPALEHRHRRADTIFSTPSARRATGTRRQMVSRIITFIHASARRATRTRDKWFQDHQFLSTPSARRATQHSRFCYVVIQFLSTPSARRATGLGDKWFQDHQISIHASARGGRPLPASSAPMALYFLSTPPRGGRPGCTTADGNAEVIFIHALREEGDPPARRWWRCRGYLSTPPRGGRRA